jgi:hypothetical protein
MVEAMICVTISQMMAIQLTVDADAPTFDHNETEDRPIPVPNASRISDNAAATNAPAITAAQDTPEEYASFLPEVSASSVGTEDEAVECSIRTVFLTGSE